MATQKDVKNRIASVKNIHKITRAMEMVAAARLRRAEPAVARSHVGPAKDGRQHPHGFRRRSAREALLHPVGASGQVRFLFAHGLVMDRILHQVNCCSAA